LIVHRFIRSSESPLLRVTRKDSGKRKGKEKKEQKKKKKRKEKEIGAGAPMRKEYQRKR